MIFSELKKAQHMTEVSLDDEEGEILKKNLLEKSSIVSRQKKN